MARIRTVKPEFWQDEKMAAAPVIDRLVFLGLISMADDAGRVLDNLKVIDAFIFPASEDSAATSLVRLTVSGRLRRGVADSGQNVLEIVNWARHQKIDKPNFKTALPKIVKDNSLNGLSPTPPRYIVDTSALHTTIPTTITTNDQRPRKQRGAYAPGDPVFDEAWKAYPQRPGNPRGSAFRAWSARIKEGVSPEAMLAGVRAYAAHCRREGTEPRYIKMAATFFGPGKHWEADYGVTGSLEDGWNPDGTIRTYTPDGHSFTKAFLSSTGLRAPK